MVAFNVWKVLMGCGATTQHGGRRAFTPFDSSPTTRGGPNAPHTPISGTRGVSDRWWHDRTGFTLIEVLIAVTIVAILASVAVPNYTRAVERAYYRQARDMMLTVYAGEQVYFATNDVYYSPGDWNQIFMDDPNIASVPVSFGVIFPFGTPDQFWGWAFRTGGSCSGRFLIIRTDRTWHPASNWPESGDC